MRETDHGHEPGERAVPGDAGSAFAPNEQRLDRLLDAIAAEPDDGAAELLEELRSAHAEEDVRRWLRASRAVPLPRLHAPALRRRTRPLASRAQPGIGDRERAPGWTSRIAGLGAAATFLLCAAGSALLLPPAVPMLSPSPRAPSLSALGDPLVVAAVALPWIRGEEGSWYATVTRALPGAAAHLQFRRVAGAVEAGFGPASSAPDGVAPHLAPSAP